MSRSHHFPGITTFCLAFAFLAQLGTTPLMGACLHETYARVVIDNKAWEDGIGFLDTWSYSPDSLPVLNNTCRIVTGEADAYYDVVDFEIDVGDTGCRYDVYWKIDGSCTFRIYDAKRSGTVTVIMQGLCPDDMNVTSIAVGTLLVDLEDEKDCSDCDEPPLGDGDVSNSSVDFKLHLGASSPFAAAGYIQLKASSPSTAMSLPSSLAVPNGGPGVEIIAPMGTMEQVKSPQGIVIVDVVNAYEYKLKVFRESDISGGGAPGGYTIYGTSTPLVTWIVKNPDGASAYDRLWITEQRSGSADRVFKFDHGSANNTWELLLPDGVTTIKTWQTTVSTGIEDEFRSTLSGTQTLQSSRKRLETLSTGEAILLEEEFTDGTTSETTSYAYYTDKKLKSVSHPGGSWSYYVYDSDDRVIKQYDSYLDGALPGGGVEPSSSTDTFQLTQFFYSANSTDDGFTESAGDFPFFPRKIIRSIAVSVGGSHQFQEVSRTYQSQTYTSATQILTETQHVPWLAAQNGKWDNAQNIVSSSAQYVMALEDGEPLIAEHLAGRPIWEKHPDGTESQYSYDYSEQTSYFTTVVRTGQLSGSSIYNGTATKTVTDEYGRVKEVEVREILNGNGGSGVSMGTGTRLSREVYTYSSSDPTGRDYEVVDLAGRKTEYHFACCGLQSIVNPDGDETLYEYDVNGRQVASTQLHGLTVGVKMTNVLDTLGRVLVAKRIGSDGTTIVQNQYLYDYQGRTTKHTNALEGVTSYSYEIISNKQKTTQTNPDGGTVVQNFYRDGRLEKTTGTASAPVRYEYGLFYDGARYREFSKEIKLRFASPNYVDTDEWMMSIVDGAGRQSQTSYPDNATEQLTYNAKNQLTKRVDGDGVTVLHDYKATGELNQTAIDMDKDGTIDAGQYDRTSRTAVSTGTYNSMDVVSTISYSRRANLSTVETIDGTTHVSTDGLHEWSLIPGQTAPTHREAHYSTSIPGARTVTTTRPDGTRTIEHYSYGRLMAVVGLEHVSTGGQVSRVDYEYDTHGRRYRTIDARNGATTLYFNKADQVTTNSTPAPQAYFPSQITVIAYDNMGRTIQVTHPDGATTINEYNQQGLLKKTYGSRTYPVEYTYDAQGRMSTMKTWQDYAGNALTATTRWYYHKERGWLIEKTYEGESFNPDTAPESSWDYSYTPGGRVSVRRWERGVTATYIYGFTSAGGNNDGDDLIGIQYSGGASTPNVTLTYYRHGPLWTTTRNSIVTTRTYNAAGLPLVESYAGGTLGGFSIEREYYASGNTDALKPQYAMVKRTGVSNPIQKAEYEYDTSGRLKVVEDEVSTAYTSTYAYEPNSHLVASVTHRQNSDVPLTTTRTHDFLNRLREIHSVASGETLPIAYSYGYNAANQRVTATLADGSYWAYSYDQLGQVQSGKRFWADGTPVAGQQFEYVHDDIGNRVSTGVGGDQNGDNLRAASYARNLKNQYSSRGNPSYIEVIGAAKVDATVTVEGSASGVYRRGEYFRRELPVANSTPQYVTVDVDTDVTSAVSGERYLAQGTESYTHDDDGNLLTDGRWTYTWDAENRLIKMERNVASPTGARQKLEFEYDFMGRRIRKQFFTHNGSTWAEQTDVAFLYDGWNLVTEVNKNSSDATIRTYLWGSDLSGSSQGAGGVGGLLKVTDFTSGTTHHFAAYDGNGNVVAYVDATTGKWSARLEYSPFGEGIRRSGTHADKLPIRFSTKFEDNESGMLYYGYRYYNPSTGRWLSRDPIEERGGTHLYAFVGNDPIAFIDPEGLFSLGSFINGSVGTHSVTLPLGPTTLTGSIGWKKQSGQCCYDVSVNLELAWSPQALVTSSLRYFGGRLGGRIADVLPQIEVGGGAGGTFVYCPPDIIEGNPNIRIYGFGQASVGSGGSHNSWKPRPPYEDWGLNPPSMNGFWGTVRLEISGNINVKTWTVSYDGTYLQLAAGYRFRQYTWEGNRKWKIHP